MDIDISVISAIGIASASLLVLLATFLLSVDSEIKTANRCFAVFLFLASFDLSGLVLFQWLLEHPWVDVLRRASVYLQMPLLFFYVKTICFTGVRFKPVDAFHLSLFVLSIGFMFSQLVGVSLEQKQAFLQDVRQPAVVILTILGELQFFFYIYLMHSILEQYKQEYVHHFADYETNVSRWLTQLTMALLIAHIIVLSKYFVVFSGSSAAGLLMYLIVSLSALSVVCWFVLKALHNPLISRGRLYVSDKNSERDTQITDNVSDHQLQPLMKQVEGIMHSQKPFLDPDITLHRLAELTSIDKKTLSAVLNQGFEETFFNYINKYRVQHAKQLLVSTSNQSILDILYNVGFSSKSSFNSAFKKHAGVTPTEFRKEYHR